MLTKTELRDLLRERLEETMTELNHALQGLNLGRLEQCFHASGAAKRCRTGMNNFVPSKRFPISMEKQLEALLKCSLSLFLKP